MLEEYQVGRGTLRESLRFLELQGIISLKPGPGGGPVVERPEATSLATSLMLLLQFADAQYRVVAEARVALEPTMARLAAERMTAESLLQASDAAHSWRCRSLSCRAATWPVASFSRPMGESSSTVPTFNENFFRLWSP